MQRRIFSTEFKVEAARLVQERGVSVAQAARDLDIHENMLRKWMTAVAADPMRAFPGQGQRRPNQKWIADFTYIWTDEGWLYVAAVIDLFSRRVVGWAMKAEMTPNSSPTPLAIWRRGKPDALLHHSDQGSRYTSEQFQRLMVDNGVICSMSRSGNVWA